ncbi:MAG: hypothetical protein DLM59_19950 [Pseudonocardiales bacterium]|nr:MAG: hypothetical protein DLM59_19950 [Pseudonocardiales bacterium]
MTGPGSDRAPGRSGIFGQLCDEWARLNGLSSAQHNLRRWATAEPVLDGATSLGDLLDRIDAGDHDEADRVLLALIRLAQGGQQLAGRVVLQAMLPKIARMTRTLRPSSNDDRWAEDRQHIAVATFWEIVYAYPVARRESRVAANLALDTLHRLTSEQRKPMVEVPLDPEEAADRLAQRSYVDPHERLGTVTADSGLLEVIIWGVTVEAVTRDEAALLIRAYLPPPGVAGGAAVAGEIDVTQAAVRQRISRARRRLIDAVRADVEGVPAERLAV